MALLIQLKDGQKHETASGSFTYRTMMPALVAESAGISWHWLLHGTIGVPTGDGGSIGTFEGMAIVGIQAETIHVLLRPGNNDSALYSSCLRSEVTAEAVGSRKSKGVCVDLPGNITIGANEVAHLGSRGDRIQWKQAAEFLSMITSVPAGWKSDPRGRHELRYWDGTAWTAHVSDQGTQSSDPV